MSRIDAPSMSIGKVSLYSSVPQTICFLKPLEFLVRAVTHLAMAPVSALLAVSSVASHALEVPKSRSFQAVLNGCLRERIFPGVLHSYEPIAPGSW